MYVNTAFLHNNMLPVEDNSAPIVVTSSGFYRFEGNTLKTHRPKGRPDYQFFYISVGKVHFTFHGKTVILPQGTAVLFRPNEPQIYFYPKEERTEVYWIHFTGSAVEGILESYQFSKEDNVFSLGISQDLRQAYNSVIHELHLCRPFYKETCAVLLHQILLIAQRIRQESTQNATALQSLTDIEQAMQYFTKNYNKQINIEAYAKSINMSTCWFIRRFKEIMKVTPMQYIIALRMTNAKTLLESKTYNISQTANHVGYDNPLYFSRLFTKFVGISPKEYQKLFNT